MPYPDLREMPTSRAQWLFMAHAAAGLLLIDDARLYGLVAGGPDIDRERCEEILTLAAAQGLIVGVDQATPPTRRRRMPEPSRPILRKIAFGHLVAVVRSLPTAGTPSRPPSGESSMQPPPRDVRLPIKPSTAALSVSGCERFEPLARPLVARGSAAVEGSDSTSTWTSRRGSTWSNGVEGEPAVHRKSLSVRSGSEAYR